MTLMGGTANVYAPGESGTQGLPQPQMTNVNWLGRYHLDRIKNINLWLGLAGLAVVAWLVHTYGGGKR